MKILHLNFVDFQGGAAIAAYRIHTALRNIGVQSGMLVAQKVTQDDDVDACPVTFWNRKMRFSKKLLSLQSSGNPAYHSLNLFPSGIHKVINASGADIVHFHWIVNELMSIAEVKKINKPIVWTLHDMWPFCGAEHYDDINSPGRYKEKYSKENRLASYTGRFDLDTWTWRRKKKHWRNVDFNFVTPSRWLSECLYESALFSGKKASIIPNCLDTDVFQPMDKKQAREFFNLPQDKQLILFSADGVGRNPLKGYKLLKEALGHLVSKDSSKVVECVIFGRKAREPSSLNGIPVTEVGRIHDGNTLAMLYSAADVFVTSSMMDNLPNTVMEAMSCGTPCAAFNLGGFPDMIDDKNNGVLAPPFDVRELADGLLWILADSERYRSLCLSAREKVERCFTPGVVAAKYRSLYEHILAPAVVSTLI